MSEVCLINMYKPLFFILIIFSFVSCTAEVTLTLKNDDSVEISFEGGAGEAFTRMISSAAGVNGGAAGDYLVDADAVSYELARAGFSDVKVNQKKGGSVNISVIDKKQTSYIFSSKIAKAESGKLKPYITRKSLEDFYEASDEQTRTILDLFLAPVFNGEEMSEDEYIEMVGSFYGDGAANEVSTSLVKINLIAKDGSKETLNIPLTQLLCGNF